MKIDLHMHSAWSDGTDKIEELLRNVVKNNISIFALTDHDTIGGCVEIREKYGNFLKDNKLKFINGIEFSTDDSGKSVHILAYNFDVRNEGMKLLIAKGESLRKERAEIRLEKLKENFGIELSPNDRKDLFRANPSKPRIANILIKMGYKGTISEIIKKYLDYKLPAYKLTMEETMSGIKKAGGVAVLAHPLGGTGEKEVPFDEFEERVKKLKACGLDGVGCFYSIYDERQRQEIQKVAKGLSLKLSGGSDYHGKSKDVKLAQTSIDGYVPQEKDFTILGTIL